MKNAEKFYFIGIGGISMSALARILKSQGKQVCGSDRTLSPITEKLECEGIKVSLEKNPECVKWCDICVYTGAISQTHSDIILANKLGKKLVSRAQLLGWFAVKKKCISVAGTHGKTTTTAMIASVLKETNLDPTVHIGGIINSINDNVVLGDGDVFLTEACEYQDSFLSLQNYISVILNIEEDHLDYFENYQNLLNSFKKFAKNTKKEGFLVLNGKIKENFKEINRNILTYGFSENEDYCAKNICQNKDATFSFDVYEKGEFLFGVELPTFGKHNIENALASIAVCRILKIDSVVIKKGLESFSGVHRRMDKVCDVPLVYHDYAHHPTEIRASINSLTGLNKKIIVVFQPHTFSRTRDLYKEFLTCFEGVSKVFLLPIYPAREEPIMRISSEQLAVDISKKGICCEFVSTFEDCKQKIEKVSPEYAVLLLGAGDIENMTKLF